MCRPETSRHRLGARRGRARHNPILFIIHLASDLSSAMQSSFLDGLDLPASICRGEE